MKLAALLLFSFLSPAQESPEIRGTVVEYGPNIGIAGATVTLIESVFKEPGIPRRLIGTAVTDARGQFSFKPGHYGDFFQEATMAGYSVPVGITAASASERVMAMSDEPRVIRLTLLRLGSLTGRFVKEDGTPIGQLRVAITATGRGSSRLPEATTSQDGVFVFRDLAPGSYVVRPLPPASLISVFEAHTTAESEAVDEDYESTYLPGGANNSQSALPFQVAPTSSADLGTMTLRRVPYQRIRVPVQGSCVAGEQWSLYVFEEPHLGQGAPISFPCTSEFLLRNVRPGAYTLALFSGTLQETKRWASAPILVGSRNLTVPLTLTRPLDVSGRFTGSAKFPEFTIALRTLDLLSPYHLPVRPDAEGRFTLPGVSWPNHKLVIESLSSNAFVKEVRYNNQPVTDGVIRLVSGATLTVAVEEGAAAVTGKVTAVNGRSQAAVFIGRWPRGAHPNTLEPATPFQQLSQVEADGSFRISGLAPGEYRIAAFALGPELLIQDPVVFERLILLSETITLDRGATKTMELKLRDVTQ